MLVAPFQHTKLLAGQLYSRAAADSVTAL